MAVEDDIRKKGHELHSLTQELQEHLSSSEETGWLEGKVHGTLGKLRQALDSMESELDMDPSQPPSVGGPTSDSATRQVTRSGAPAFRKPGPQPKAPGTLTPEDFPPVSGKGLDVSVLRNVATSELQRFDVSKLQKKFAEDADFMRQFIEGTSFAAFDPPAGAMTPRSAFPRPNLPDPLPPPDPPEAVALGLGGGGGRGGGSPSSSAGDDDSGPSPTSLDAFFSKVGSSLVAAQRQLDQRSQEYMANLEQAGMGRDLATLYRIPKVNAELKFALEDASTEKLNLLIHSQGTQASTLNQQTVQFEIAAVPAPPEALDAARKWAPTVRFVLDPTRREEVFGALAASALPWSSDQQSRVLIVELSESEVLLTYGEADLGAAFGLWHLDLSASPDWSLLFEVKEGSPDVPPALRAWVADLSDRQASFLAGI